MKRYAALIVLFLMMAAVYYLIYMDIGPIAECRDGTLSFSKHHSGTCSYHGGVREWKK